MLLLILLRLVVQLVVRFPLFSVDSEHLLFIQRSNQRLYLSVLVWLTLLILLRPCLSRLLLLQSRCSHLILSSCLCRHSSCLICLQSLFTPDILNPPQLCGMSTPSVSPHLQELFDVTLEQCSLSPANQQRQAAVRNDDTFAKNSMDIGYCSVLEHDIDTGDAHPISNSLLADLRFLLEMPKMIFLMRCYRLVW